MTDPSGSSRLKRVVIRTSTLEPRSFNLSSQSLYHVKAAFGYFLGDLFWSPLYRSQHGYSGLA